MHNWLLLLFALVAVLPIASFTEVNVVDGRQYCCHRIPHSPFRNTKFTLDETTQKVSRDHRLSYNHNDYRQDIKRESFLIRSRDRVLHNHETITSSPLSQQRFARSTKDQRDSRRLAINNFSRRTIRETPTANSFLQRDEFRNSLRLFHDTRITGDNTGNRQYRTASDVRVNNEREQVVVSDARAATRRDLSRVEITNDFNKLNNRQVVRDKLRSTILSKKRLFVGASSNDNSYRPSADNRIKRTRETERDMWQINQRDNSVDGANPDSRIRSQRSLHRSDIREVRSTTETVRGNFGDENRYHQLNARQWQRNTYESRREITRRVQDGGYDDNAWFVTQRQLRLSPLDERRMRFTTSRTNIAKNDLTYRYAVSQTGQSRKKDTINTEESATRVEQTSQDTAHKNAKNIQQKRIIYSENKMTRKQDSRRDQTQTMRDVANMRMTRREIKTDESWQTNFNIERRNSVVRSNLVQRDSNLLNAKIQDNRHQIEAVDTLRRSNSNIRHERLHTSNRRDVTRLHSIFRYNRTAYLRSYRHLSINGDLPQFTEENRRRISIGIYRRNTRSQVRSVVERRTDERPLESIRTGIPYYSSNNKDGQVQMRLREDHEYDTNGIRLKVISGRDNIRLISSPRQRSVHLTTDRSQSMRRTDFRSNRISDRSRSLDRQNRKAIRDLSLLRPLAMQKIDARKHVRVSVPENRDLRAVVTQSRNPESSRNLEDINKTNQEENTTGIWQIVFYTLQGIYICGVVIQMFKESSIGNPKKKNNCWWKFASQRLVKVD